MINHYFPVATGEIAPTDTQTSGTTATTSPYFPTVTDATLDFGDDLVIELPDLEPIRQKMIVDNQDLATQNALLTPLNAATKEANLELQKAVLSLLELKF